MLIDQEVRTDDALEETHTFALETIRLILAPLVWKPDDAASADHPVPGDVAFSPEGGQDPRDRSPSPNWPTLGGGRPGNNAVACDPPTGDPANEMLDDLARKDSGRIGRRPQSHFPG